MYTHYWGNLLIEIIASAHNIMTQFSRVPPELLYTILSFIRSGDKEALRNCSLVCKVWLNPSRDRLFHSIDLRSPSQLTLLVDRVLRSETMKPWLASVRKFCAWTFPLNTREGHKFSRAVNSFIHTFAGHLPNLHTVTFHMFFWDQAPCHPRIWAACSAFPSIRKLELSNVHFPSFDILRRLLESLPSLIDLTYFQLEGDPWQSTQIVFPHFTPYKAPTLLRLRFLIEKCYSNYAFFCWLLRTPSVHTIRELSLAMVQEMPAPNMRSNPQAFYLFVEEVASKLASLETFIFGTSSCHDLIPIFLISSYTSLRLPSCIGLHKLDGTHSPCRRLYLGRSSFLSALPPGPAPRAPPKRRTMRLRNLPRRGFTYRGGLWGTSSTVWYWESGRLPRVWKI